MRLLDVNDNYPMFPNYRLVNANFSSSTVDGNNIENEDEQPIFEVFGKIEENAKLNTRLEQLRAVDLDKESNITYMIVHSSADTAADGRRMLAIDKFSGAH